MDLRKKASILVAEDDEDDRLLLKIAFDENGYKDSVEFVIKWRRVNEAP